MEVTVEKTGQFDHDITVRIPSVLVSAIFEREFQNLAATVRLPGFRPGKTPRKLLESRFGHQITLDVSQKLISESFHEALQKIALLPVGAPTVEDFDLANRLNDFVYTAKIQVMPEVTAKDYQAIPLTKPVVTIGPEDVDTAIQQLQEKMARFVVEPGRQAQSGDEIILDFVGTVDGQPFEGGTANGYTLLLGSGAAIEGFEEQLIGTVAGEYREIKVTFPANYNANALSGKDAVFACTVQEVRGMHRPAADDDLAVAYGIKEGGLDQLREQLLQQLQARVARTMVERLHQQARHGLLIANPMDLPSQMVEQEIQHMTTMTKERLKRQGFDDKELKFPPEIWVKEFDKPARERLAVTMLLEAVGRQEKIVADQAAVNAMLDQIIANERGANEHTRARIQQDPNLMNRIREMAQEQQIMAWLLAHATTTEFPMTLAEFEQPVPPVAEAEQAAEAEQVEAITNAADEAPVA